MLRIAIWITLITTNKMVAHLFVQKNYIFALQGYMRISKVTFWDPKGSDSVQKGQCFRWTISDDKKNSNWDHFSYKREPSHIL